MHTTQAFVFFFLQPIIGLLSLLRLSDRSLVCRLLIRFLPMTHSLSHTHNMSGQQHCNNGNCSKDNPVLSEGNAIDYGSSN